MIPQVKRLLETKDSDGLSLTTWGTWACCQVMSMIYAISISATAYIIVNIFWVSFYWLMVCMIIKYRKRRSLLDAVMRRFGRGHSEEKLEELVFNAADNLAASTKKA